MRMNPAIKGAFAANGGLLSREKALDLNVSPSEIRHLVDRGEWVRVRRGVYALRELWDSLDPYVERPRLVTRAATMQMRRGWVLSHDSSALEQGMAILHAKDRLTHVTRPGYTNAWTKHGVKHHLAGFSPRQVVVRNGVEMLDLARTAVDIGRESGFTPGLVACDSALRMGVTREELIAAYERMTYWPGIRAAKDAVRHADPGAANPNETLGRELVLEAGIGEPDTQFPIFTPRGLIWCDIRVGNHIIETDGRVKYRPQGAGGVATKDVSEVVWEERTRERLIRDENLGVTRLTWADYWGQRRTQAIERLRADHADSVARFGIQVHPRLAAQAAQIRAEYEDRRRTA